MSGFFGAGVIPGGVVLGNLLAKAGQFGPIFTATATVSGWVKQTAANPNAALSGVVYGNGQFVTVGDDGTLTAGEVETSPNAVAWTGRANPFAQPFIQVARYAGGVWLAGGSASALIRSTDNAVTWANVAPGPALNGAIIDLQNNGVTWLALSSGVGPNNYAVSGDGGLTWVNPATLTDQNFFDCIYDGTQFVAVGIQSGTFFSALYTSVDGSTWTETVLDNTGANLFISLVFSAGVYILADGATATVRRSATLAGLPGAANLATGLGAPAGASGHTFAAGGGRLVLGLGVSSKIGTSTDNGLTWSAEDPHFVANDVVQGVAYGAGQFVAVGADANISTRAA